MCRQHAEAHTSTAMTCTDAESSHLSPRACTRRRFLRLGEVTVAHLCIPQKAVPGVMAWYLPILRCRTYRGCDLKPATVLGASCRSTAPCLWNSASSLSIGSRE